MRRTTYGMALWGALAILCCTAAKPSTAQESRTVLIQAQHVHLGDGQVLSPGSVLVSDGKIVNVAESQPAPEGAETVEVDHLMPGLVDAYASAGGIVANDAEITREVTADFTLDGAIDWTSRTFDRRLAEGVTTLHLAPGTDNVFAGLSTIVKTTGVSPEQRTVQDQAALVISVCSDPAQRNQARSRPDSIYVRQPTNRMGVVWIVRSQLHKAKLAAEADVASLSGSVRIMQEAIAGDKPVFAVSRTQYDMRALFSIAQEFGISPVVIGGEESWRIVDELVENHASVVLGPLRPGQENGPERAALCDHGAASVGCGRSCLPVGRRSSRSSSLRRSLRHGARSSAAGGDRNPSTDPRSRESNWIDRCRQGRRSRCDARTSIGIHQRNSVGHGRRKSLPRGSGSTMKRLANWNGGGHRNRRWACLATALFAATFSLPSALGADTLAIKDAKILTGGGETIEKGSIVMRDGKIVAVGADIEIPVDARVIDGAGKIVMPGIVEVHSAEAMSQANEQNDNVPFLSVVDSIDPSKTYFEESRRNGVTTVAVMPGNSTMIGGSGAVLKTSGAYVNDMLLKRDVGMKFSLTPQSGSSRMSHFAKLRRQLREAKEALDQKPKPKPPTMRRRATTAKRAGPTRKPIAAKTRSPRRRPAPAPCKNNVSMKRCPPCSAVNRSPISIATRPWTSAERWSWQKNSN